MRHRFAVSASRDRLYYNDAELAAISNIIAYSTMPTMRRHARAMRRRHIMCGELYFDANSSKKDDAHQNEAMRRIYE